MSHATTQPIPTKKHPWPKGQGTNRKHQSGCIYCFYAGGNLSLPEKISFERALPRGSIL